MSHYIEEDTGEIHGLVLIRRDTWTCVDQAGYMDLC